MRKQILLLCLMLAPGLINVACVKRVGIDPVEDRQNQDDEPGKKWNRVDTANETVDGIQLIFKYDEVSDSFIGTIENMNNKIASKVSVEVHIFDDENSIVKYGPTDAQDLGPGEKLEIIIRTANDFTTFCLHPQIG